MFTVCRCVQCVTLSARGAGEVLRTPPRAGASGLLRQVEGVRERSRGNVPAACTDRRHAPREAVHTGVQRERARERQLHLEQLRPRRELRVAEDPRGIVFVCSEIDVEHCTLRFTVYNTDDSHCTRDFLKCFIKMQFK